MLLLAGIRAVMLRGGSRQRGTVYNRDRQTVTLDHYPLPCRDCMKPLLKLHQVTHFYGRVAALRDVTLELPGGPIGLIGQNGAVLGGNDAATETRRDARP